MNNGNKPIWGFCGVLGLVLVKIAAGYLGANGYQEIAIVVLALILLIMIGLLLSKHYYVVAMLSFPVVASIISTIGICFSNLYLMYGGIGFIIIYMKLLPRLMRRYKSKKNSY